MYKPPHLDLAARVLSVVIKSKWGTFMSSFLCYREFWESTHWHIDYSTLYTLNPHNETLLHFHMHSLSLAHLCMISVQGQFTCVSGKSVVLEHLLYHGPIVLLWCRCVCVCVGVWWVEVVTRLT